MSLKDRKGSAAGGASSKASHVDASAAGDKNRATSECRAAYILVLEDVKKDVQSRDDLEKILQQAGRNPSQKTLNQYWTTKTKKLSFEEVCNIFQQLKPTSEDELLKAFRKIDVNGDGFITQRELTKVLTQRGEKMSAKEVEDMIAEADQDGDKKLNYKEFCKMVMSTTSKCQESSLKRLERKERKQKRTAKSAESTKKSKETSSTSYSSSSSKKKDEGIDITLPPVSRQQPSQREPSDVKNWYHSHTKGCFHFDDDHKIVSHQYVLEVAMATKLWLTVRPISVGIVRATSSKPKVDVNVFMVRQGDNGILGEMVAFSHIKNKEKYCLQCDLKPGTYRLIPMTTGCQFKMRTRAVKKKVELVHRKGDECELTKEFKNALNDIYEMVDLDGNGLLSRNEFNLFQLRTSGEAVDDDAWEVVEENFELKKGELTRKGFMDLNQMEANDGFAEGEGGVDDLWVTLSSMGFADDLVLDEACPFMIDVYTEYCSARIRALPLQRGGATLEKIICQSVINAAGFTKVKTIQDVCLHTYLGDGRATIVVENKGSSKFRMRLDCTKTKNCLISQTDFTQIVQCHAGGSTVALHLVPEDEDKEWTINCQESPTTAK